MPLGSPCFLLTFNLWTILLGQELSRLSDSRYFKWRFWHLAQNTQSVPWAFFSRGFCAPLSGSGLQLLCQAGPARYWAGNDTTQCTHRENPEHSNACSFMWLCLMEIPDSITEFGNTRFNLTNSTTSMPGALEWEVPCMDKWVLILPLVAVEEKWDWIHFLGSSSHSFSKYLLSTFQAPGTVQMLRIYDLIDW